MYLILLFLACKHLQVKNLNQFSWLQKSTSKDGIMDFWLPYNKKIVEVI